MEDQGSEQGLAVGLTIAVAIVLCIGMVLLAVNLARGPAEGESAVAETTVAPTRVIPVSVYFPVGGTELDEQGRVAIDAAARALAAAAALRIAISGFVDTTGTPERNAELAKLRAFAVRDAFVAAGLSEDRIELRKPEEIVAGDASEARRVDVNLAD
jgi:flagellar motor protein MotB